MKKIPTMFQRDVTTHLVTPEIERGCEWVAAGEGIATRKWDGTACLVKDGALWKRHTFVDAGILKDGFIEEERIGAKSYGWVEIDQTDPADKWHVAAWLAHLNNHGGVPEDGTYELIGPKVQGNPERTPQHILVRHGALVIDGFPRVYGAIREDFATRDYDGWIEGVVFHHPDGRMAKVKARDFGLKRPLSGRAAVIAVTAAVAMLADPEMPDVPMANPEE
jgi:hypothetical protein